MGEGPDTAAKRLSGHHGTVRRPADRGNIVVKQDKYGAGGGEALSVSGSLLQPERAEAVATPQLRALS